MWCGMQRGWEEEEEGRRKIERGVVNERANTVEQVRIDWVRFPRRERRSNKSNLMNTFSSLF